MKDVTAAADATIGSLYHFFPGGKERLAAVVFDDLGRAYLELFEMIAEAARTLTTPCEHFFDGAADVLEETDFIDICPIGTVAREVASTNEPLRQVSNEVFGELAAGPGESATWCRTACSSGACSGSLPQWWPPSRAGSSSPERRAVRAVANHRQSHAQPCHAAVAAADFNV